jgi:uncharacterized protein YbjT (DUF2867 family)
MSESRVLVVGATGQLGSVITRKLLAAGVPVRAFARSAEKLAPFKAAGAEVVAGDLLDLSKITEACRGVGQIVATANNNMGKGATSPMKIDVSAYQNLLAAARNTGVRRVLYVSFRGVTSGETVDIFRLKWYIEDAIRRSGVPHVIVRPTAFMDIWIDHVIAPDIRKKGVATIFGDGTSVTNYVAVEDVAEYVVKILAREEIRNENIDVGGPSDKTFNDVVTLVERQLGSSGKRRHMPVPMMSLLMTVIKPFNELTARMISLGHYNATHMAPFPKWRESADRFGVKPRTIEEYVSQLKR